MVHSSNPAVAPFVAVRKRDEIRWLPVGPNQTGPHSRANLAASARNGRVATRHSSARMATKNCYHHHPLLERLLVAVVVVVADVHPQPRRIVVETATFAGGDAADARCWSLRTTQNSWHDDAAPRQRQKTWDAPAAIQPVAAD